LKEPSRQLTAAFYLITTFTLAVDDYAVIHHNWHRSTHRPYCSHVSESMLHKNGPPAERITNWLAGGTTGGALGRWNFQWYRIPTSSNTV